MKRVFCSALILLCFGCYKAQEIGVLEIKNGFKTFKLNSNKSDYAENLISHESLNGCRTFNYKKTSGVDASLFNLFDYKVNTIHLTFDNATNSLKKISLNLDEILPTNQLTQLGYRLKKLYTQFEEIIGTTTSSSKPTRDCYQYKSQSCVYFEDRIFDGKIIWESNSVVLLIEHKTEPKINFNGTTNLDVSRTVSFIDKSYYKKQLSSGF